MLVRLPVGAEPLIGSLPLQPPEALQLVALAVVQFRVALPPFATVLGLAVSTTDGEGCVTDTVADCDAVPPAPVQEIANVVLACSVPLDWLPAVPLAPLQPPAAVQAVAFDADHASVVAVPAAIALGLAPIVTVGAAADTVTVADCMAVPPGPVQVSA